MRIAVILPKRRLGLWHEQLVAGLSQAHAVAVFIDDYAPAYPLAVRAWLRIERFLYRRRRTGSSGFHAERFSSSSTLDEGGCDVVVDLAERPQPRRESISIRYDGSTDSMALVRRLLSSQTPHLTACGQDAHDVLAESMPAIDDKLQLTRGLQLSFARCISLVERALFASGRARKIDHCLAETSASRGLGAFIGRFIAMKATKLMFDKLAPVSQWTVAIRHRPGPFVPLTDDGERYYADPFLYAWCGRTFLFLEEYRRATNKGVISVGEIVDDRLADEPIPVLARPYHLSYPIVVADAGAIFMLPETKARDTVELYRAVKFPWKWELESILIDGMALADATPLFHQNRWWLFAAGAKHGTTDHDELFIFYSDKLAGPWRPHFANPVKSDCRSARPAGRIVSDGTRLLRPAQDCDSVYGAGIVWLEIVELSPSSFREAEIARFNARRDAGREGLHHFDQVGQLQVVDMGPARSLGIRRPPTRAAMKRLAREWDLTFATIEADPTLPFRGRQAHSAGANGIRASVA